MSFSHELYALEFYKQIHFVGDQKSELKQLIPEFTNPFHQISSSQKELYHSLCVISGNFPQMLWNESLKLMQQQLDLPDSILELYIQKISDNFNQHKSKAMTGPFIRGDYKTQSKNLQALDQTKLQPIYESFQQQFKNLGENL